MGILTEMSVLLLEKGNGAENYLEASLKQTCLYLHCIAKSKLARHNFSNYISQMCDLFANMTISIYHSLESSEQFQTITICSKDRRHIRK